MNLLQVFIIGNLGLLIFTAACTKPPTRCLILCLFKQYKKIAFGGGGLLKTIQISGEILGRWRNDTAKCNKLQIESAMSYMHNPPKNISMETFMCDLVTVN